MDQNTLSAILEMKSQMRWMALLIGIGLVLRVIVRRRDSLRNRRFAGGIGPTLLARLAGGLPADAALIAGIGDSRPARQSLDTQVMGASLGVRLLCLVVLGLMLVYVFGEGLAYSHVEGLTPVRAPLLEILAIAGAIWSNLWIWSWELRWNRDEIILTRLVFWRSARKWRDLTGIRDGNHHHYVLRFDGAPTLPVLKHATGIGSFLDETARRLKDRELRPEGAGHSLRPYVL